MRSLFACVVMASLFAAQSAWAADISKLVIFGDSLSDTGNVHNVTSGDMPPDPPYFEGRFSNGRIWVDHLAAELGLPDPVPSTEGGDNYAFGGSLSGATSSTAAPTPPMLQQIQMYLDSGATPGPDELFILWSGANDFLLDGEDDPAAPVANLVQGLTALVDAGATRFLVPNLPRLTALPGVPTEPSEFDFVVTPDQIGIRSGDYNALQGQALDLFELANPDVDLTRFAVASLFERILQNPRAFGFTNTTEAYLATGSGDPSNHLFWDSVHATSAAHAILGSHAAALIPEPAVAAVLFAAAPLLLIRRR